MRLLRNNILTGLCLLALALIGPLLTGCEDPVIDTRVDHVADPQAGTATAKANNDLARYSDKLHIGDAIRIDFSGTPTAIASINTQVKGDGTISLDLVGDIMAEG